MHVQGQRGEAKFWIEPEIALAQNYGLAERDINDARKLVEEREDEIREAWHRHFGG